MLPGVKALLVGWRKEYNQVLPQFHCGMANLLLNSPCQQPCGLDRSGGWHKRGTVNDSGLSVQRLKEREENKLFRSSMPMLSGGRLVPSIRLICIHIEKRKACCRCVSGLAEMK